jgi:hypothetical protein
LKPVNLATGASLFIVVVWVVFKALDVEFDDKDCNAALSVAAYVSLLCTITFISRTAIPQRFSLLFLLVAIFASIPLVLLRLLSEGDNYPPYHREKVADNLTCLINEWGEPMDQHGRRARLQRRWIALPFLHRTVATMVAVTSDPWPQKPPTCEEALDLYRSGETLKVVER